MKNKLKRIAQSAHDMGACIVIFIFMCVMAMVINAMIGFQWLCAKARPEKRIPISLPPKTEVA